MTQHATVQTWIQSYERLWRTPGTDTLTDLFTTDATYKTSPWAEPIVGLPALAEFWESHRDGPDESFTMSSEVVAVDGPTAVVRVSVEYGGSGDRWLDLWIIELDDDGRCTAFEEWPIAPDRPASQ
jgi:hypothetical protein